MQQCHTEEGAGRGEVKRHPIVQAFQVVSEGQTITRK